MKKSKKVIPTLGIGLFLLTSISCFATTGTVTVNSLRIRDAADTSSEIIEMASEDEKVEIIGEDGDWYKVKYNGVTGYASKNYIETAEEVQSASQEEATQTSGEEETNKTPEAANESFNGKTVQIKYDAEVKVLPTFSSRAVCKVNQNEEVKVIYDLKKWLKIEYNSNSGWIARDALQIGSDNSEEATNAETVEEVQEPAQETPNEPEVQVAFEEKQGYINVETANVREEPSKSSTLINTLDEFDKVTIKNEIDGWYEIESDNVKGYVSKPLITIGTISSRSLIMERTGERANNEEPVQEQKEEPKVEQKEEPKANTEKQAEPVKSEEPTNQPQTSNRGQEVVNFAKQYLGYKYVYGGKSPSTGFDCSGFTRYVFSNFGFSLSATASGQTAVGKEVKRSELKAGDLLLFYDEGKTRIGHVGIYIGGDQFIHAANPKRGVVIDKLSTNSYYNVRFVTARRIVN